MALLSLVGWDANETTKVDCKELRPSNSKNGSFGTSRMRKKEKEDENCKSVFFSGTSSWVKRNIKMTHGKFLQTRFKMALMEWKKKREKKFTKFCKSCVSDTGWAKLTEKKEKRRSGSNFAELVLPAPVGWKETAERFSSDCTASHARPWGGGSWLTNLR